MGERQAAHPERPDSQHTSSIQVVADEHSIFVEHFVHPLR
jgi:hypothetical protein